MRILQDREDSSVDLQSGAISVKQSVQPPQYGEDIIFDDAMEALGEDGFSAVAGALDMFRKSVRQ